MIIGFYSIIYAWRKLVRPGISAEVRNSFMKKHTLYVIVNIVSNGIQIWINYYELFNYDSID